MILVFYILGGKQRFLSYTEFVMNNFGSSRAKLRKMLEYYYKSYNIKISKY